MRLWLQPIGYMSSSYSSLPEWSSVAIPKAGAFAAIRHSVSSDAYSLVRRRPVLRAFPIACATLVLSTPLECCRVASNASSVVKFVWTLKSRFVLLLEEVLRLAYVESRLSN